MTGLISLLPVVNLLIIPSVWYQIRKPFFISIIAIIMAVVTWFFGGQNYYSSFINNKMTTPTQQSADASPLANTNTSNNSTNTIPFPQSPLYYINFHPKEITALEQTVNQYIRIKLIDSSLIEGKNKAVSQSTLELIVGYNNTQKVVKVLRRDIKSLEVLNETSKQK
ncbi:MAG: hypothetical protein KAH22_04515 [Thiotrichaceae bacterium]|nr:hypothetical protein [Thiotrichaceae bacterium]